MDNARVRRPLTKVVRFEQSAPHLSPVMSSIPLPAIEVFDTNNTSYYGSRLRRHERTCTAPEDIGVAVIGCGNAGNICEGGTGDSEMLRPA